MAQGKLTSQDRLDALRTDVPCAALLERDGYGVDVKESTPRAVKYRHANGAIVIVIHEGKGWFDPLSEAKGDVFSLALHLGADGFPAALARVGALVGYVPEEPAWERPSRQRSPDLPDLSLSERWQRRTPPSRGSPGWGYLTETRALPAHILDAAIAQDVLREGPQGSMWAAHRDNDGVLTGWEERGPNWRGFAGGGTKTLFRLGDAQCRRVCVTEAAIDAMSLATLEGTRSGSLYVSTGGGWSPATGAALHALAARSGTLLVAATDADAPGEIFAGRLCALTGAASCAFMRMTPADGDWNSLLKSFPVPVKD